MLNEQLFSPVRYNDVLAHTLAQCETDWYNFRLSVTLLYIEVENVLRFWK
jgi:hypothetical protein